jgi:hypothetical protein
MSITSLRNSTRLILCFVLFFPALFKDLFRWFFFPGSFPFMAHLDACVSFDVTHCHAKIPRHPPEKTSDWTCPAAAAAASIPKGIRYYGNCNKFQVVASDGQ